MLTMAVFIYQSYPLKVFLVKTSCVLTAVVVFKELKLCLHKNNNSTAA